MTRPNFYGVLMHNPVLDFTTGLFVGCNGHKCEWVPRGSDPYASHREHIIAELNFAVDEWLAPFAAAAAARDDN